MKGNRKGDRNRFVVDMSVPAGERGQQARKKKRTTPRQAEGAPAQMSHGNSPRKKKNAQGQAKKKPRQKKRPQ